MTFDMTYELGILNEVTGSDPENPYVTILEVAAYIARSPRQARHMAKKGIFGTKNGGSWIITKRELILAYKKGLPVVGRPGKPVTNT